MTFATSAVRANTDRAVILLQQSTSLLNINRTNVSARVNLETARNLLNDSLQNYLIPSNLYPKATRIMLAAACIVADYWGQFAQTQVSIPPLQSSSVMADDMAAVCALVQRSDATHRAIANGNWGTGTTWNIGVVPASSARVYISASRNVTYNVKSTVCVRTVGIFGTLSVSRNTSTRLLCDTIVVGENGNLNIKTSSAYTTSIEFGSGAISVAWDSRLISRGLISMGTCSIVGATITPYVMIDNKASAKATQISAMSSVVGWRANDPLYITPVVINPKWQKVNPGTTSIALIGLKEYSGVTSVLFVSALSGNRVIKLTTSCKRSYQVPQYVSATSNKIVGTLHRPYVANARRNVVFRTITSTVPHRRAHVMFMMGNNNVRYAKFKHLGRTDKSLALDDIDNLQANASLNSVTPITPTRRVVSADANPKGRYPIHFHRIGVETTDTPGVCYNNYVSTTPGWGIAHHDSYVLVSGNVVYKYFGAGFVAEVGNERGKWRNNLAMVATSPRREILKLFGAGADKFKTGVGFAFTSRNVSVIGNIAAAFGMIGYGWLIRGSDLVDVPASILPIPEITRYDASAATDNPEIITVRKNRAFCGDIALEVVKGDPNQRHQVRTFITSTIAWEITTGLDVQYTAHYTFRKGEFLGIENYSSALQRPQTAASFFTTGDLVLVSCYFRNFQFGPNFSKQPTNGVSAWVYNSSVQAWAVSGSTRRTLDYVGFMFVDGAVTSWGNSQWTGTALNQSYRGTYAALRNNGTMSVTYTSATKHGSTWISHKDMTNAAGRLHRIRGSIRDSLGTTNYPVVFQADGNVETWNSDNATGGSDVRQVQRNILKNFGYFQVSNAVAGHKQYVVIRDYFRDRRTGSVDYRQFGWKVSTTPVSSWNGMAGASIRMIQKVTTIASIVVPAWDGRTRNLEA